MAFSVSILRSILISLSLYSRVPVPVFTWDEKDVSHAIAFLPLTGILIGALSFVVIRISGAARIPVPVAVILLSLVPLLVTGGFHLDGFMDVTDARRSYLGRERKLQIMKDPHIGAFAVIGLLTYCMIWGAGLYQIVYSAMAAGAAAAGAGVAGSMAAGTSTVASGAAAGSALALYPLIFFISRALCGLTSVCFAKAKKDGMLRMEAGSNSRSDLILLTIEAVTGAALMIFLSPAGALTILGALLFTVYYRWMCNKEFGGVTGDTAGYYVTVSEEVMVVILAIWTLL